MAAYLLLDENNVALNCIEIENEGDWTPPEGQRLVRYDGPFWPGQRFDGRQVEPPYGPPSSPEYTKPVEVKGLESL